VSVYCLVFPLFGEACSHPCRLQEKTPPPPSNFKSVWFGYINVGQPPFRCWYGGSRSNFWGGSDSWYGAITFCVPLLLHKAEAFKFVKRRFFFPCEFVFIFRFSGDTPRSTEAVFLQLYFNIGTEDMKMFWTPFISVNNHRYWDS
jgi:hypothetical protein